MQEDIVEGLPAFLNELNEMTFWSWLGLVTIYLIVREIMRARYHKRARSMITRAINGPNPDDAFSAKPSLNPHGAHDPAMLFTWLVEEFRVHRKESNRRFSRLEEKVGEIRGELNAMKGGGP